MPSDLSCIKINCDILIFGTGIAGLTIAEQLTRQGYKVVLVEKNKQISSGATTRSGDLVHAGGFHSALIADEERALNTGYHCARGSEIILADCPEGVWTDATPVFLAVNSEQIADRTLQRWQTLGIKHRQVSRDDAL